MSVESPAQAPSRLAVRRACPGAPGAIVLDKTRLGGRVLVLAFSLAAVGAGAARGLTTTYLPVLLERIRDAPRSSAPSCPSTRSPVSWSRSSSGCGPITTRRRRLGRRLPLMVAGTALAAGGLLAIALGNASSYLALALAAALVYTGLNALTTLHRALVVDDVGDDRRPAVTSAQEIAATVGAGIAVGLGAALIEPAPGLAFVLGALVLVAAAVPTMVVVIGSVWVPTQPRRRAPAGVSPSAVRCATPGLERCFSRRRYGCSRTPRCRASSCSMPGTSSASASASPVLSRSPSGSRSSSRWLLAGRARGERVQPLLLAGAVLLGAGACWPA